MTPARDPKHFCYLGGSTFEEASGRRHLGGGIWVEASGRRHLGGIWEEASGRRHLGEASARRHLGGSIWEEASGGMPLEGLWEGLWEGSGRALGGLWDELWGQGCLGWSVFIKWHHSAAVCKSSFFCSFHEAFLRVPLTKSAAGQRLRIPGSNPGLDDRPGGLYQHCQDPTS